MSAADFQVPPKDKQHLAAEDICVRYRPANTNWAHLLPRTHHNLNLLQSRLLSPFCDSHTFTLSFRAELIGQAEPSKPMAKIKHSAR